MSVEYTKEMIADLTNRSTMTFDEAKAFADKYDISVRSVISKCRAVEVEYQPQTASSAKSKSKPKITKADVAKEIEALMGVEFKNLTNLVMDDLEALKNFVSSPSEG